MKKTFLLLLCIAISASVSFSQNTQRGFSFQGIARDLNGKALGTASVDVQISIIQTGKTYIETQNVTTDAFGVFSLVIGSGSPADFALLDFSKDSKLKVEVKANGVWGMVSTTDLLSVPYAKAADVAATAAYAQTAYFPAGVMMAFAGPKSSIPDGWLVCEGQAVSRTTYAALYASIGDSWGNGDGSTTFNLPYTQGQFLRGVNSGTGQDPNASSRTAIYPGGNTGDNVGSFQTDELKAHAHDYDKWIWPGNGPEQNQAGGAEDRSNSAVRTTTITGGNETRPKNVYVYYIIKY